MSTFTVNFREINSLPMYDTYWALMNNEPNSVVTINDVSFQPVFANISASRYNLLQLQKVSSYSGGENVASKITKRDSNSANIPSQLKVIKHAAEIVSSGNITNRIFGLWEAMYWSGTQSYPGIIMNPIEYKPRVIGNTLNSPMDAIFDCRKGNVVQSIIINENEGASINLMFRHMIAGVTSTYAFNMLIKNNTTGAIYNFYTSCIYPSPYNSTAGNTYHPLITIFNENGSGASFSILSIECYNITLGYADSSSFNGNIMSELRRIIGAEQYNNGDFLTNYEAFSHDTSNIMPSGVKFFNNCAISDYVYDGRYRGRHAYDLHSSVTIGFLNLPSRDAGLLKRVSPYIRNFGVTGIVDISSQRDLIIFKPKDFKLQTGEGIALTCSSIQQQNLMSFFNGFIGNISVTFKVDYPKGKTSKVRNFI